MSDHQMTCEDVLRLAWQLEEMPRTEQGVAIRQRVEAHCANCSSCQRLWDEELWLTTTLVRGRAGAIEAHSNSQTICVPVGQSGRLSRLGFPTALVVLAAAIALMALLAAAWFPRSKLRSEALIPSDRATHLSGFARQYPVVLQAAFCLPERPLDSANLFQILAGFQCRIELCEIGSVQALGPAVIGLDCVDGLWKVTMLEGDAVLAVRPHCDVLVANREGSQRLKEGQYAIGAQHHVVVGTRRNEHPLANHQTVELSFGNPQQYHLRRPMNESPTSEALGGVDGLESPGETLARGLGAFQSALLDGSPGDQAAPWHEIAATLELVMMHPEATSEQRCQAGFYRIAALSNAGMENEVIQAGRQWLKQYPANRNETILFVVGLAHWTLKQPEEAKGIWHEILSTNPESPYRVAIESQLAGQGSTSDVGEPPDGSAPSTASIPALRTTISHEQDIRVAKDQRGGYLVVSTGLDPTNGAHDGFRTVAQRAIEFHRADHIQFDGRDFGALQATLAQFLPRYVLFVIPPNLLDINFQRQVFLLSPTLDEDVLADFSWGYLTARDGLAVNQLWSRIEKRHRAGLPERTWMIMAVVGGGVKSQRLDYLGDRHPAAAGFTGSTLYFGLQTTDPEVLDFAEKHLPILESAAVISITGNGDPQGIWLFDDRRNANAALHWPFDPKKVGQDPHNEMWRLTAAKFRQLKLNAPIIWSGTCHSGACHRVFVEPDIASTFGRNDRVECYELDPDESLTLAWIDAGAAAILAPIGSNHGMALLREQQFALEHGVSLGEALKSTYDDVLFQAGGLPNNKTYRPGQSFDYSEPIMQAGGSNRILIGDPALKLFSPTPVPGETQELKPPLDANGPWQVLAHWRQGFHPTGWNMYREVPGGRYRVPLRVELPEGLSVARGAKTLHVMAKVYRGSGEEIDCTSSAFVEWHLGRTLIHLQADLSTDPTMDDDILVEFTLSGLTAID